MDQITVVAHFMAKPGKEAALLDVLRGLPASGSVISREHFTYEGGNRKMSTPTYTVDIALRIKRVK